MATSEGPQAAPSVNDPHFVTKPRVIPANQLVILREDELDCDLSTAIQRVRESEATSGSRILIVSADVGDPRLDEETDALPLPQLPMSIGQVARSGGRHALELAGQRLKPKLESLDCLLREANHAVHELAEATPGGVFHAGVDHIRVVREVLSWVQANAGDLQHEVAGLSLGFQAFEISELLQEVQGQAESFFPKIRVNVAPAIGVECWGEPAALAEALFLAIVIAVHRIGGHGSVNLEAEQAGENSAIRVFGLGEPMEVHAPQQMQRLKEIVCDLHGGRITPDTLGPFGTGLLIELRSRP